ncbi:hypothetical protein B0H17DRAFT_1195298 [Mycena rosella]|uniref:Uncharacterized protein n=1 Tax=Mycena rosella TaxID=1033263 RepID=A0AAD7DWL7_MYCRO|nr:hypothetical protein B0H17DRAFT_1195298 [Mycena rosella]
MGFPTEGLESFYRNNRVDAKQFLEHRSAVIHSRTTMHHCWQYCRSPHVRWLSGWTVRQRELLYSTAKTAGKGRSRMLACMYLLLLERLTLGGSQEDAQARADKVLQAAEQEADTDTLPQPATLKTLPESPAAQAPAADTPKPLSREHKGMLDLHTAQRMKPSGANEKAKQGVSIPSQRRWLHYWVLLLAQKVPAHLWAVPPLPFMARPKAQ